MHEHENEIVSEPSDQSKKSYRGALILAVAMALGLVALIAFNMN